MYCIIPTLTNYDPRKVKTTCETFVCNNFKKSKYEILKSKFQTTKPTYLRYSNSSRNKTSSNEITTDMKQHIEEIGTSYRGNRGKQRINRSEEKLRLFLLTVDLDKTG